MKLLRKITLLFILALSLSASAQVKISQMPALGTGLDSMEFPVIKSSVNYRVSGGKFIINQYAKRQTAAAWLDSARLDKLQSSFSMFGDTAYGNALKSNGSAAQNLAAYYGKPMFVRNTGRSYVYAGDGNNWNLNYAPLFSAGESGKTVADIKRGGVGGFYRSLDSAIGGGPWGNNAWWPSGSILSSTTTYNLYKGNYTLTGSLGNYDNTNTKFDIGFTPKEDSFVLNVGTGTGGMMNVSAVFGVYGTGRFQQYNGQYYNFYSYFRPSVSHANSYVDKFSHFHTANILGALKANTMYGYFAGQLQSNGYVGRPWAFYSEGAEDRNYFAGQTLIGDTSLLNADAHKLYVAGSAKITGNILGTGRALLGSGVVDDGSSTLQLKGAIKVERASDPAAPVLAVSDGTRAMFEIRTSYNSNNGSNSIYIGDGSGATNGNTHRNTVIGSQSFKQASGASSNVAVGGMSLRDITNACCNTAVGDAVMYQLTTGGDNVGVGQLSLASLTTGNNNVAMGTNAADGTNGSNNVVIGKSAMRSTTTAANNVVLGQGAGSGIGNSNVIIGYAAGSGGSYSGAANRLVIANSNTNTPLIHGEFDNGRVTINSILNLAPTTAPTSSADASGVNGDVKLDASGNLYIKANGQWLKFTGVTF